MIYFGQDMGWKIDSSTGDDDIERSGCKSGREPVSRGHGQHGSILLRYLGLSYSVERRGFRWV